MLKNIIFIVSIIFSTSLYCNEVFSFLVDYEISYGTLKIVKKYALENNIDVNLSFNNQKNNQQILNFQGFTTSDNNIINYFKKNNNYTTIEIPFYDTISLCAEKITGENAINTALEDLFTILSNDYIVIINKDYNRFFPDHLQDFDLHFVQSSQHCNSLIINGKTFGFTNHTECINHPNLKEIKQFAEKKIHFSLIINKKYHDFIEYFMNNLDIFKEQGYIFEE